MTSLQLRSRPSRQIAKRLGFICLMAAGLSACQLNGATNPVDTAGFREARYNQVVGIRAFQDCRTQGLELDQQARARGSAGAYLNSARVLASCESSLTPGAPGISGDERLRVSALSTLNYLRGGDVEKSRQSLNQLQKTFPDSDLYYADGASFLATMETLLGRNNPTSFGQFAALNVNEATKREMRRVIYWKNK